MRIVALFALCFVSLSGGSSPETNRRQLQRLNEVIVERGPNSDLDTLLRERARMWKQLAVADPAGALALTLPEGFTRRLATRNRAFVEERGEWRGKLETVTVDDFRERRASRFQVMRSQGRWFEIYAAGEAAPDGEVIVRGARIDNKVAAASIQVERAAVRLLRGERTILGVLVNHALASLPSSVTPEALDTHLFAPGGQSVDSYLREVSGGKMWAAGTVLAPVTIAKAYRCGGTETNGNYLEVTDAALDAVRSQVDVSNFATMVFVVAPGLDCGGQAFAFGETVLIAYSAGWNPFGFNVIAHEVGHTLSLGHARTLYYPGAEPLGAFRAAPWLTLEYGSYWDLMGHNQGHFSAMTKVTLGWLDPSRVADVTTSGSHTILPLEWNAPGVQALRVRRGASNDDWLWLEYRQPIGFDQYDRAVYFDLPPDPYGGALVYYESPLTPRASNHQLEFRSLISSVGQSRLRSQPLPAGQKWDDPYSELSIEVLSAPRLDWESESPTNPVSR